MTGSSARRGTTFGLGLVALASAFVLGVAPAWGPGGVPPVAAEELPTFVDCEELRQWYVDRTLPHVTAWGLDSGHVVPFEDVAFARAEAASSPIGGAAPDAVGSSGTGTNVQEAGIDEPDLAKTDGRLLVRIDRGALVVEDVTGQEARRLSRTHLADRWGGATELLLVGRTVLALATAYRPVGVGPDTGSFRVAGGGGDPATRVVAVDIGDPTSPVVTSRQLIDGELVSARDYGDGTVRLVVSSEPSGLRFTLPDRGTSPPDALRTNRQVVREAPLTAFLPGVSAGTGPERSLLDCSDVRHPARPAGMGTLSVLAFDAADPSSYDAAAVAAAGRLVYSSADRLYVATIESTWWGVVRDGSGRAAEPPSTQIHSFALDGATTTYVASGTVPGTVRDRWSFDEHDGRLRVATALGPGWEPRENSVQVLEEQGSRLVVVGGVAGLGPREQIQSVRWLGDLAVVVTFRQTDPLYTVDLSEPTSPAVLGELKIPGFSAYLHPVGGDLLLGIGQDADLDGTTRGAQAALFDLTDVTDVRRSDTLDLGRAAAAAAQWEPRAFTYLPDRGLALVPVEDWRDGGVRLEALRVGGEGSLAPWRSWHVARWGADAVRALPLADGRVAVVSETGARLVSLG